MRSRTVMMLLAAGVADLAVEAQMAVPVPTGAGSRPVLRALRVNTGIRLDGRLDDAAWGAADSISDLLQIEPVQGGPPSGRTVVRVLVSGDALILGVRADDPEPDRIVGFARERDATLANEDHIKFVLDTYRDGRSGYVFAVNPNGARYDALVAGQGESENANWDAVWDAAAVRTATGWSAELVIPMRSLQFAQGLTTWGFNVQRRVQRRLENDRWASPVRDYKITQTFRAGDLTDIPAFALGLGLSVRPSVTGASGIPATGATRRDERDMSLDVTQTLGANVLAALTVNTDFAENGSRHATHEPDAIPHRVPGEAHLLPAGRRHLRLRRGRQ